MRVPQTKLNGRLLANRKQQDLNNSYFRLRISDVYVPQPTEIVTGTVDRTGAG